MTGNIHYFQIYYPKITFEFFSFYLLMKYRTLISRFIRYIFSSQLVQTYDYNMQIIWIVVPRKMLDDTCFPLGFQKFPFLIIPGFFNPFDDDNNDLHHHQDDCSSIAVAH